MNKENLSYNKTDEQVRIPTTSSSKTNETEYDVVDAFAAAMGQAVAPPKPTETKVYKVVATEDGLHDLETFMTNNYITFKIQ